jgi:hypothetical protein
VSTLRTRVRVVWVAALAATGLLAATLQSAEASTPQDVGSTTIEVVADGLNAPRGIYYDRLQQRLLFAEAGDPALNTGPCGFAERGLPMCLGPSGSVTEYKLGSGSTRPIATGLPSTTIPDTTVTIGVHDVTMGLYGQPTVVFGTLGNKPYRESLGPGAAYLGHAATITASGAVKPFADVLTFQDNLHPGHIESNPFGVITTRYGTVIANAGGPNTNKGNDLLLVTPNKKIVQLAQFPEHPSVTDPTRLIRSVPTSVVEGRDGALYVGELSGAPFFPGEARIWRVVPGKPAQVLYTGFSTIVDLTLDDRGRLIVLQTSADPFDSTGDGKLIRIEHDGSRTELASAGLTNPGGVASVGHGVFYVTSKFAGGGGEGTLLKVTTH